MGNLVNRALGFTQKSFSSVVPSPEDFDDQDKMAEEKIKNLSKDVGNLMEQNHLDRALKKILEFSAHFNQYFQHKEPWKKEKGTQTCVYLSVNAIASIAITLNPFLPQSGLKIWRQLDKKKELAKQSWNSASELLIKPNHKICSISPLFSKVEDDDIERHKKKFQSN